ncbi:hypothetical protein [Staphylococcus nepalensis]|nr:hypothetical protein [Staphylococcus nepalensis]
MLIAGFIGVLIVILILNFIGIGVLKKYERLEVIIGIMGLVTTFLGAYIGARIAGSESRKLFKQQIKMNDLQQNMDTNIKILEEIGKIPKHINKISDLLYGSKALYPKNIEKIKDEYKKISDVSKKVKDENLSKSSIVIYRDVMHLTLNIHSLEDFFFRPISFSDTKKLIQNTIDDNLSPTSHYSWSTQIFDRENKVKYPVEDYKGEPFIKSVSVEEIIKENPQFFKDKLGELKKRIKFLDKQFNKMTYKNLDDLINDYSKLYKD